MRNLHRCTLTLASSFRLLCSFWSKNIEPKEKNPVFSFANPTKAAIAENKMPLVSASWRGVASGIGIDKLLTLISLISATENIKRKRADIFRRLCLLLPSFLSSLPNFKESANIIRLNSTVFSSERVILTVRISVKRMKTVNIRSVIKITIFIILIR